MTRRLPLGALVLAGEHALLAHVAIRHRDGSATVSYYSDGQPTLAKGRYPESALTPVAAPEDPPPPGQECDPLYGLRQDSADLGEA